jgi:NADH-quinone oxidoreductase subunit G/NADP-reducing hydrogenase subunit HndD
MMVGAISKAFYAKELGMDPKKMFVVSVMPCTAKKFEITRPEMENYGLRNVDAVITTRELARMIREVGIDFQNLAPSLFDAPLGLSSGAADIFGTTGGVMEAALRTIHEIITGRPLPGDRLNAEESPLSPGIKEAALTFENVLPEYAMFEGFTVRCAVASGFQDAKKLMEGIAAGQSLYHFIEVMGCPGGCVAGGGQPRTQARGDRRLRAEGLLKEDKDKKLRKAHENPAIGELYKTFLGEPLGDRSHDLLHTHYTKRGKYNELLEDRE